MSELISVNGDSLDCMSRGCLPFKMSGDNSVGSNCICCESVNARAVGLVFVLVYCYGRVPLPIKLLFALLKGCSCKTNNGFPFSSNPTAS